MLMKTFILSFLVFVVLPSWAQARLMKSWTYQEMFDQADLVVIAHPSATKDTPEKSTMPDRPIWDVVAQETEFKIGLVTKGDKNLKQFLLHHYRLMNPQQELMNGPNFASFNPRNLQSYLTPKVAPVNAPIVPWFQLGHPWRVRH
jgi:hypothetical protein